MKKRTVEVTRVRHWIYCWLIAASVLGLAVGYGQLFNQRLSFAAREIIRNISFGCIASAIVAWLIEYSNVREENRRMTMSYDLVYSEFRFSIYLYITEWARMCCVAYKDKVREEEKHSWKEWYDLVKLYFWECNEERQKSLLEGFFLSRIKDNMTGCINAINKIDSQESILTTTGIYNAEIKTILRNFYDEFGYFTIENYVKDGYGEFWEWMDAINADIKKYISDWEDIRHYNELLISPAGWLDIDNIL